MSEQHSFGSKGQDGVVDGARHEVAALRKISPRTEQSYKALVRRLIHGRAQVGAKATARQYRAAWIWQFRIALLCLLKEWERDQSESTLEMISQSLKSLKAIREGEITRQPGKSSKRNGMGSLPPAWQMKMVASVETAENRALLAMLATTGLRPSELAKGVSIACDGTTIMVTIVGSKAAQAHAGWACILISP